MNLKRIIDAITQEFGVTDLAINQHPDGMQSIHVPRSDVYLTSTDPRATDPHALWEVVRGHVRRDQVRQVKESK